MPGIIVLEGPPRSGKSTWIKKWLVAGTNRAWVGAGNGAEAEVKLLIEDGYDVAFESYPGGVPRSTDFQRRIIRTIPNPVPADEPVT